jgi:hypothetical protein
MEMEQMIERLLAEIRNNQVKMNAKMDSPASRTDVNQASHEQMKTQIGSLASRTDIKLEDMEACHEKVEAVLRVRGDHETSGGRCPGVCRPKNAGPPQGNKGEECRNAGGAKGSEDVP